MTLWTRLCLAAIRRHRLVWRLCGANPATWPLHEMQIVAVYGLDTFQAAHQANLAVSTRHHPPS